MSDLTGELIDNRYLLKHRLASGGMATIYSGIDTRLDRPVAVKIMHSHLANDEAFVSRFIKEAKATAALSHPNIVSIQDQGWNQGGPPAVFLVMELVDGSTLRDFLNENGSLTVEQTLQIMNPVVSALAAAHKIGIIHRDIKPENILISKDGRIKVAERMQQHLGADLGADLAFVYKRRPKGSTNVAQALDVIGEVEGRLCILTDDMIDTGGTIVSAAHLLLEKGATEVWAMATHGVLSGPAVERLSNSRIDRVVLTNTLPLAPEAHIDKIKVLSVGKIIADALAAVFDDTSVSEIFGGENQA